MHRFYVAANLVSQFIIGYEGEPDNFYIMGQTLLNAPIISGRIYGPNGEFLFGLISNKLATDYPGRFRPVGLGTRPGWSIQDDSGQDVLTIETLEGEEAKQIVHSLEQAFPEEIDKITRIYGEFFDSHGDLAARGDASGLEIHCPYILG